MPSIVSIVLDGKTGNRLKTLSFFNVVINYERANCIPKVDGIYSNIHWLITMTISLLVIIYQFVLYHHFMDGFKKKIKMLNLVILWQSIACRVPHSRDR